MSAAAAHAVVEGPPGARTCAGCRRTGEVNRPYSNGNPT